MALALPYDILAGDEIDAVKLQPDFQAIKDRFSHGITGEDISTDPTIPGSCLVANSTPGDRIQSATITQAQMAAGSVGTGQLIDANVTKAKMSTTVGQRVTAAQMEDTSQTIAFSLSGIAGFTYCNVIAVLGVSAGNYIATISWIARNVTTNVVSSGNASVSPTTPIPAATNAITGLFIDTTTGMNSGSNVALTGNVRFQYRPLT